MTTEEQLIQHFGEIVNNPEGLRALAYDASVIALSAPSITSKVTLFTDVIAKTNKGFLTEPDMVGVGGSSDCDTNPVKFNVNSRAVELDPRFVNFHLEICLKKFVGTIATGELGTGQGIGDIDQSDLSQLLTEYLALAILNALERIIWDSDEDIASAGYLSDVGLVPFFTALPKGLWKQIFELAEENPTIRIKIPANEEPTYVEQLNAMDGLEALRIMNEMQMAITPTMAAVDAVSPLKYQVTNRIYRAIQAVLSDPTNHTLGQSTFIEGVRTVIVGGYPVENNPSWSHMYEKNMKADGQVFRPHRILLAPVAAFAASVDGPELINTGRFEYDKLSQKITSITDKRMAVAIMHPESFIVAY